MIDLLQLLWLGLAGVIPPCLALSEKPIEQSWQISFSRASWFNGFLTGRECRDVRVSWFSVTPIGWDRYFKGTVQSWLSCVPPLWENNDILYATCHINFNRVIYPSREPLPAWEVWLINSHSSLQFIWWQIFLISFGYPWCMDFFFLSCYLKNTTNHLSVYLQNIAKGKGN